MLKLDEFQPRAPSPPAAGAGLRIRPLGGDDHEVPTREGETMPKGVYDRKKKAEGSASAAPDQPAGDKPGKKVKRGGRKPGRKPKTVKPTRAARAPRPSTNGARFGIWDDGSVHITTEGCAGTLTKQEASDLVAFVKGK